ncbi:MAG: acyl-CoA thioesterase [Weeksellaceae bacterium]|nr:acyl-CoA thioesterase [Weeksellaceae bacterium]
MQTYKTQIDVRWSDLDVNAHLANAAYITFTSQARMEALRAEGLGVQQLKEWGYGPVIFSERFQYFREIMPHQTVHIHTRCTGTSENLVLFEFEQQLYGEDGTHHASSSIFGCWIDMNTRSMAKHFIPEMKEILSNFRSPEGRNLSLADIKQLPVKPKNISPEELL